MGHKFFYNFFIAIFYTDYPCHIATICLIQDVKEFNPTGFAFDAIAFHVHPPVIDIGKRRLEVYPF